MDGAFGGQAQIAGQPAQEELPDLTGSPVWFVALEADDQALDLAGQLVSVAHGAARAVAESLEAMLLVAVKDLVAGFA